MTPHLTSKPISYENVEILMGPGIKIDDFEPIENWYGRPASDWSLSRIGFLQSKIEKLTYEF